MILDAAIRPDDWNLPLFLHVLGAMVMVGSLAVSASYLFAARGDGVRSLRTGYRALLLAAIPSFIVMRVAAQWIADEQGLADSDAAWIGIGFMVSDIGALLVIVATVLAGLAVRRAGRGEGAGSGRGAAIAAWLVALLLVLYVFAAWAMTTKPT